VLIAKWFPQDLRGLKAKECGINSLILAVLVGHKMLWFSPAGKNTFQTILLVSKSKQDSTITPLFAIET